VGHLPQTAGSRAGFDGLNVRWFWSRDDRFHRTFVVIGFASADCRVFGATRQRELDDRCGRGSVAARH